MGEIVKMNKLGSEDKTLSGKTGGTIQSSGYFGNKQDKTKPEGGTTTDVSEKSTLKDSGIKTPTSMLGDKLSVDASGAATVERPDAIEKEHDTPAGKAVKFLKGGTGRLIIYAVIGYILWKSLKS